ncbi:MAG: hypothetical protein GXO69_02300 [Acidobacteria bacterium]|nr:hypothetical protein [Acidobacteriota bacterium]
MVLKETEFNFQLGADDILREMKYKSAQAAPQKLAALADAAVKEIEQTAEPAWGLNLEADLEDFEFTEYTAGFPVRRLSLAAVTLGSELDTAMRFHREKGEDAYEYMLQLGGNLLVESLADHVNYLICGSRDRENLLKPAFRKSPGVGRVPLHENRPIADYLMADRIQIQVTDLFQLVPKKTILFFVEWGPRKFRHNDLKKRCHHCGKNPCEFRI